MDIIHSHCAGLDVHKKTVVACRIIPSDQGGWIKEIKTFGTFTDELLALLDWLRVSEVRHVAMESTGVYWKPIYNILEAEMEVLLVNARHIKFVPGRKTDVKDAQWIAELLQHGLLKASYIPSIEQRDLRDIVRYRTRLIQDRAREINRVQKVLEDANIKLASVVSDIMGVSSRDMLAQLISGQEDPSQLAQLARSRLRDKIDELTRALVGHVREHHRLLLKLHLEHIDELSSKIDLLSQEIDRLLVPFDQIEAINRLDEIPGVDRKVAEVIVAEFGLDMDRFPTAGHAASWVGLVPGRNQSAGRNRNSRTNEGNKYLKSALVQAAHAAGKNKKTYLGVQYQRLASRRGKKRAAIAVAHSIIVIAYHMLARGTVYQDMGADYFDKRNQEQVERRLVKRLESLGYKVALEPVA